MTAGFQLSFNIEGEQQLSKVLLLAADKIRDWAPAFQETAQTMQDIFSNQVFATQGAIIDEHWSPLSRGYALVKTKKYPGKGLLEATGEMKNGFLTMWRPDMAEIWNKATYFKYHQSNQPRSKMPRRVMIKLAAAQKDQIVKIFHNYFEKIISTQ